MPLPAGPKIQAEEIFAAALGVGAAVMLIGTSFLLRWQRNRQRFELARLALENGATSFPKGPPSWLVSLREAVTTIALGVGLLAAGGVSYGIGSRTPPPSTAELRAAADEIGRQQHDQDRQQRRGGDRPRIPGTEQLPPEFAPEDGQPPREAQDRRGPQGGAQEDAHPPVPIPELDRYRRAQAMTTIGLLAMGCGGVLTLLGLIRAGFARFERQHDAGDA